MEVKVKPILDIDRLLEDLEKVDEVRFYNNQQDRELFIAAVHDFRGKMERTEFWSNPESKSIALQAFMQSYTRTNHGDYEVEDASIFKATLNEFWMRLDFMVPVTIGHVRFE